MQVFFAHPSSCSLPEIKAKTKKLTEVLVNRAIKAGKESPSFRVVPGRLDHQRNWRGNWDLWAWGLPARKSALTGDYAYGAFIVQAQAPSACCGRATASILSEALRLERPVFLWDGEDLIEKVAAIKELDSDDWTSGWMICSVKQWREE